MRLKILISLKVIVALCDILKDHCCKKSACIAPFIIRIIFVVFSDVSVFAQRSYNMETYPAIPENKLATNFSGLRLSTYVTGYTQSGSRCQWEFGDRSPIVLFDRGNYRFCRNVTGSYYISNCVERNSRISTTLIITDPIGETTSVRLQCRSRNYYSYSRIAWINITVAGGCFICRLIASKSKQISRTSFHMF